MSNYFCNSFSYDFELSHNASVTDGRTDRRTTNRININNSTVSLVRSTRNSAKT